MTELAKLIKSQIEKFGPMTIADYMTLCLSHPEHGYYIKADPLGAGGDFTTSPEISQMFGELLGLCLAQSWIDQGQPSPFVLAELGPGRGTLMADMLRACRQVPGFVDAAQVWLVETSPVLRQKQAGTLKDFGPCWANSITELPDLPLFLVANEFFDALPIRQFVRMETGWQERMIGLTDGELSFGLAAPMDINLPDDLADRTSPGDLVEFSIPSQSLMGDISACIKDQSGVAIIVDYGDWASPGDTFQAVRNHQKTTPFDAPGFSDLTAHVDFAALVRAVTGVRATGMTDQGVLLERLGITARARHLAMNLRGKALENHIAAHRRLTHIDEMGSLFKAIAFYPSDKPAPPGFDQ